MRPAAAVNPILFGSIIAEGGGTAKRVVARGYATHGGSAVGGMTGGTTSERKCTIGAATNAVAITSAEIAR
jgi:hypothetical protein